MNKFLIVVAHPDDAELMFGGIINNLTAKGNVVEIVVCTNGALRCFYETDRVDEVIEIREREQMAAAETLGVKNVIFLEEKDGSLKEEKLERLLVTVFETRKPNYILTHSEKEYHSDHKIVVNVLKKMCNNIDEPSKLKSLTNNTFESLYFFADISELDCNNVMLFPLTEKDITNKVKALMFYKSQFNLDKLKEDILTKAKFFGLLIGEKYAEPIKIAKINKYKRFKGFFNE